MEAVEFTRPGTPARDDPQVEKAMGVWDALDAGERREVFRTLYRAVLAHRRTSDIDHFIRFAESVDGMVRLESATDLRRVIRDSAAAPGTPQNEVGFASMAGRLEE